MTLKYVVKLSVNLDLLLDWWDAFALYLVMSLEFSATMNQLFYWLGESCSSCVLTIFGEQGFGGLCSKNAAEDWGWDLSWRVLSSKLWFCLTTLHFCYYATVPPVQRAWKIDLVLCIWVRESTSKSTSFCLFFFFFPAFSHVTKTFDILGISLSSFYSTIPFFFSFLKFFCHLSFIHLGK